MPDVYLAAGKPLLCYATTAAGSRCTLRPKFEFPGLATYSCSTHLPAACTGFLATRPTVTVTKL